MTISSRTHFLSKYPPISMNYGKRIPPLSQCPQWLKDGCQIVRAPAKEGVFGTSAVQTIMEAGVQKRIEALVNPKPQ